MSLSSPSATRPVVGLRGQLLFILGSLGALTLMLTLLRGALLAWNWELAAEVSRGDLLEAFFNGLRFDLRVVVIVGAPLMLTVLSARLMALRGLQCLWLTLATVLLCLLGTTELSFYQEFHQRLNTLVFQYLQEDPATVLSMLWYGFPVLRLLLGLALVARVVPPHIVSLEI